MSGVGTERGDGTAALSEPVVTPALSMSHRLPMVVGMAAIDGLGIESGNGIVGGERSDEELAAGLFTAAVDSLALLDAVDQIRLAGRFERRLESVRLLAAAKVGGTDTKRTRAAMTDPSRSSRSQQRDARRAATVAANDGLAAEVAAGTLSGDAVDALARAADNAGSIPADLIAAAAGLPADQTNRMVGNYLADQATRAEVNERYAQQRTARRARRYRTTDTSGGVELAGIAIEGPDAVIDRLWNQLCAEADRAYRAAGGRDRPVGEHTSWPHRLFDAAIGIFDGKAKTGHGKRPAVVVTVPLHGQGVAYQAGTGPIGDDLIADYAAQADLFALITDLDRQPLWLGRARRHGSSAQFLALVIRDRGCVLCGAAPQRCEAHHLMPWEAPGRGATDLANLALLCGGCHRRLHQANQTLYWRPVETGGRIWLTRSATQAEAPPPRPVQRE